MERTPHIDVRNLKLVYKTGSNSELTALDDINFTLGKGETLGIVGESGCGKSSLARAFLSYTRPGARIADGQLYVSGVDILRLDGSGLLKYRGGRAALVPQNPLSSLTPHLTIGQHLTELIRQHNANGGITSQQRALDLLAAMELPDPVAIYKRYPHQLSGGQRQRVVIAAALVAEPELIVLDEPTTALDKTVESQVLLLVARLQKETNTTLVYVSHDLNVIARMCERVLVMQNGKVVEEGETKSVFNRPQTEYTRTLIAAIPKLQHAKQPSPVRLADSAPILTVKGLDFTYGRPKNAGSLFNVFKRVSPPPTLQDISLTIQPGSTLGVVGESGSGKSTLASLVAGLVDGNEGKITFDGKPLSGLATGRQRELRRRVQMIFQDPASSLNPQHSVEQIIGRPLQIFFGMTRAASRDRIVELLEELDLPVTCLGRLPRQLSGGQQQRVAIARAFACKPDLVLCDEVTSALDVTVQAHVLGLMKRLQREHNTAYLFISHDLPVVADMSDQILVLEGGRIRDYSDTGTILNHPNSPYTRKLLEAFAIASGHIAQGNLKNVI
ncbi:dipeptide ABC transporter ATP-binding protein [Phyllobacterium myrsinacearum]|uniref:Peptide/nickel transport system ATP-binding protein n=1 Tax=Phyllobacterium myrsinacearum TaxID=28101 RepID=A0A839EWV9_9HYPH|nr:ABC transporter ATP-binding protein [Phyllobacterium myrsinacearum]MBA8880990.1 peptide/nickel transport system ATP-binding protein [Phyllobacterium myrsinacearum]